MGNSSIKRILFLLTTLSMLFSLFSCKNKESKQKYTNTYLEYFDTVSTVVGYFETEDEFEVVSELVEKRLSEYHMLYDIYHTYEGITNLKDINALYDGVHKEFTVDERIVDMLLFSKEMYILTVGETNIAMGSVLSLWHNAREAATKNPSDAAVPLEEELLAAAKHTDIDNLIIDKENKTVFINDPEMTLDVGAVAKGYATEMIARELEALGASGITLNIGGNIRIIGAKPGDEPWVVGIESPDIYSGSPYAEYMYLRGGSLVTSGSYQRFYYVDGKNYHHIIDKDTLYPSEYYTSVSVYATDSGFADSLSTALFSMDVESGMALIEKLDNVEALWIAKDGTKTYSDGFKNYCKK